MNVYLDQNIISAISSGRDVKSLGLPKGKYIYSQVHINEIARSAEPERHLAVLDKISAAFLDIYYEHFIPQDHSFSFVDKYTARKVFDLVMTSKLNNLAPLNDIPFKHLYVLANGGQADREFLETFAADVLEPFRNKIDQLDHDPIRDSLEVLYDNLASGFHGQATKRVLETTYSVEEWQCMIGSDNGKLNNITGDNILRKVWDSLDKSHIKELTPEEYFGFETAPSQFCGIAICNGVFDVIGLHAEGKRRKFEKQDNVQSDAQHISMGTFCDYFASADKKAVLRAQVIYEFLGLKTQARLVEL